MKKWFWLVLSAVCAVCAVAIIGGVENQALQFNTYTLSSQELPTSFDGFRIVQVSDLHNAEIGEGNEKLLTTLQETQPNIIVLTGDLIDSRKTKVDVALEFAEQAMQIAPCYYVTGNHEARVQEYTALKEGLTALGVVVLEDTHTKVELDGESITLLGVNDPSFQTDYLLGDAETVMRSTLMRLTDETDGFTAALEYEKRVTEGEEEPTLTGFLEEVFLISDVDKYDESADAVVLMTVHAAKGLEFPVVFLAGMEDGIFPSEQDKEIDSEMSEERRLAYVAITRAKEMLYISYAKERMMYGRTLYGRLSCFIRDELPVELTVRDVPRREPPRRTDYFSTYRDNRFTAHERVTTGELARRPEISNQNKRGAEKFGVEKLTAGDRVSHAMFGSGVIVSSRDMGGDVLYEVNFDNGQTKKLMATFAKLKKI